jgi:mTERF domain-containing protein
LEDAVFQRLARELGLERKWQPLMEYLTTLGICEGDFQRIADRHKACLQANVTAVQERVEFLVSLGVKREHLRKLIVRHPQIIEYTVERAVKPRIQYLKSLGLPENAFGRVITVAPTLLECSLQRSLKPRVRYLVDTVGVKEADMGLIITRSPQVSALIFMLI